jgi:uncharacterized RDD family membrane protein YckC
LIGAFVNPVVESVDLDDILGEIDLNELLGRIDLNELLARIDVNALVGRIDVDAFLADVDLSAIIKRASVSSVVSDTAGSMATSALDVVRSAGVGVDVAAGHAGDVLMRRDVPSTGRMGALKGRPAGAGTRLAAYALDVGVIGLSFSLTVSVCVYLLNLFLSKTVSATNAGGLWWTALTLIFAGIYFWGSWAISGRTVGMAVLGIKVVSDTRPRLGGVQALVRLVVFPLSFILGLGFVGLVFGRHRRAWHDMAAHSLVVYDWGDRQPRMPRRVQRWAGTEVPAAAE